MDQVIPSCTSWRKNTYTMLCIPCWNELSSTHQGTADVKDHCASNVKEIQPLLQFETICWHPSRILHVKWVRCLLCRLRLCSLFCAHFLWILTLSLILVRSTTSCTLSSLSQVHLVEISSGERKKIKQKQSTQKCLNCTYYLYLKRKPEGKYTHVR